ncbi:MAG: peptide chain release factor N(5)-glutamine methyltransferase, partial [Chloroflexota bacterium]|nr:peptide chain release factor N(5)-glutamine methyltransferase [Chloroflexota bacterium]
MEAELLLAHILHADRTRLYALSDTHVSLAEEQDLEGLLARRLLREPLAYILGVRWFYGLELAVRPGVLIPRPETELLVERAIALAGDRVLSIADVGAGGGNIAVALAVYLPRARLFATDISPNALQVAAENVARHGVAEQVTLLHGDLLAPLSAPVDMIAANLPYVRRDALPSLQPELRYEPVEALDGGPDGLDLLRRLLAQAPDYLASGGWLLAELDPWQ